MSALTRTFRVEVFRPFRSGEETNHRRSQQKRLAHVKRCAVHGASAAPMRISVGCSIERGCIPFRLGNLSVERIVIIGLRAGHLPTVEVLEASVVET